MYLILCPWSQSFLWFLLAGSLSTGSAWFRGFSLSHARSKTRLVSTKLDERIYITSIRMGIVPLLFQEAGRILSCTESSVQQCIPSIIAFVRSR